MGSGLRRTRRNDDARIASEQIAREEKIEVAWKKIWQIQPFPFHPQLIEMGDAAIRESFVKAGYEVVHASPQQTAAMVQREFNVWGPVVKQLGLKPE